jgi:hypothetical protein
VTNLSELTNSNASPPEPRAHRPRRWRRFFVVALLLAPVVLGILASLALGRNSAAVHAAYVNTVVNTGKQPAFLLTTAFLLTFGVVRLITYAIHDHLLPILHDLTTKSGLHVHHMVPGMLLVLISGYLGLVLTDNRPVNVLAVLFGIGAALVLDEFALWLRLADVYWQPAGRESVDAVILAGGVALLYLLGIDYWPKLIGTILRTFGA